MLCLHRINDKNINKTKNNSLMKASELRVGAKYNYQMNSETVIEVTYVGSYEGQTATMYDFTYLSDGIEKSTVLFAEAINSRLTVAKDYVAVIQLEKRYSSNFSDIVVYLNKTFRSKKEAKAYILTVAKRESLKKLCDITASWISIEFPGCPDETEDYKEYYN